MLAILPVLAFAFLTAGFRRKQAEWREALLYASVPWSLFLDLVTETLTQFRLLTRTGVALSWLGFAVVCFVWNWKIRRGPQASADIKEKNRSLPWDDQLALI